MHGNMAHIAWLGFGEAAQAFLTGLRGDQPVDARAFDLKTLGDQAAAKRAEYDALEVSEAATAPALAGAPIIFSLVTADQAAPAALSLARTDLAGALFLDANSCAPQTKQANAQVIEGAGGRYVDMAVMQPVHPALHRTACQLSGPHAAEAVETLTALGMNVTEAAGPVGTASMRKMVRSVMIKGIEALTLECMLAARRAGVEDNVLQSLGVTYPGIDWPAKTAYNIERTTTHGIRRAAEMREVAKTVEGLGLPPHMSRAIADWQQAMGDLHLAPGPDDTAARADAILAALGLADQTTD
ncbi:DUF1932 domain-containing protein [Mesobacterium pallidum]|uniref:DUF1932 domain-containing protein n=1 Tax=Mesobacterium pallidum TaxID=2872037 RepID=UPI001EE34CC1|nr:NAD(P)-dependent oxidoreductase [Mesobacterium pallidum]